MAPTFEDFIQSPQFTFLVGKEGKPVVVHAAAVAATSQQLDALIHGGMEESEKRCARMEDVDVSDFIRFCEYAYRGDYTVPPCEELELPPETSFASESELRENDEKVNDPQSEMVKQINGANSDSWDWPKKTSKKKKLAKIPDAEEVSPEMEYPERSRVKHLSRTQLRVHFNLRAYSIKDIPKTLILQNFEAKSNNAANQNFTPVFLAHARLYSFAHVHLVESLKTLALHKLHKTLSHFKLYTKQIGNIVQLARYAYSTPDLPDRSDKGDINELRKLIVEYIVCEVHIIGRHREFIAYMEEGGEFVGDFWRVTREHVV